MAKMMDRWLSRFLRVRRMMSLVLACTAWMPQAQAADKESAGWRMNVPNGYRQAYEDEGQTLVLTPANPEQFLVRFTYHSLKDYVKERPKVGREFIEHLAGKKGLKTFAVEGNGGVAYLEPPVVSEQDGGRVQETAGGLGLDDAYVTFTVVIDEAAMSDPAVKELLRSGIQVLLGRIHSAPG
ncbi:hypothetical protein ASC87_28140 [Rhizobacter sp. Root1221]|nr:hypothetical protein ASC87_28140 [Rhizobacter sp. Root1221]